MSTRVQAARLIDEAGVARTDVTAPLLLIGHHPREATHYNLAHGEGSCGAVAFWPSATYLWAVTGIALVAVAATEVTLRRPSSRSQPADIPDLQALDQATRADAARSAVAAASALGLILLNQIVQLVDLGAHSNVCTPGFRHDFNPVGNVYSWAQTAAPWLDGVGFALFVAAIATFFMCRRARVVPPVYLSPDA